MPVHCTLPSSRLGRLLLAAAAACVVAIPAPVASAHVLPIASCPNENLIPTPANVEVVRAAARCLVNRERRAHGLGSLGMNTSLQAAAQRWAQAMVDRRYCSHGAALQRLYSSGYRVRGLPYGFGEALGWDYGLGALPRAMLLNRILPSPLHHFWLMGARFQHIGIGVVAAVCQDGSPAGATYVFDVGRRR